MPSERLEEATQLDVVNMGRVGQTTMLFNTIAAHLGGLQDDSCKYVFMCASAPVMYFFSPVYSCTLVVENHGQ